MSTETVRYTRICAEDLFLGNGTRNIRFADQAVRVVHDINLQQLLSVSLKTLRATDFSGTALMTWSAALPAGARIWGVTRKITTAFGVTGGLTGHSLGEPADPTRWSNAALALTLNDETDQGDFSTSDLPLYPTATDVWVSAIGGTYDATGVMEVAVYYALLRHPS